MNKNNIKHALNTAMAFSLVSLQAIATADDTEVFLSKNSKPNLLFIMDMSASMKWGISAKGYNPITGVIDEGSPPSRADVMKNAVKRVLNQAPDEINIGLMSYGQGTFDGRDSRIGWNENYRSHGVHGVSFPIEGVNEFAAPVVSQYSRIDNLPDPSAKTVVRQYLSDIVDSWQPYGGTPIVDSLIEASRYFAGDKVAFGQDIPSSIRGAHPSSYEGEPITRNLITTPRDIDKAPNYKSPITDGCQQNYIALLSDGDPTNYYLNQTKWVRYGWWYRRVVTENWGKGPGPFASYMKGDSRYGTLAAGVQDCEDSPSGFKAGQCGPEVTKYMSTRDMNRAIPGKQNIKVFTVGYSRSIDTNTQDYLKSLVTVEDNVKTPWKEGYYSADDSQKLKKALTDIIETVAESASTLGSPSYSVNVLNGLEHEDEIYIPIFSKASGVRWSGNLKKFGLVNTSQSGHDVKVIMGKNNLEAFDEQGTFTEDALDYWSDSPNSTPDGSNLRKGGVASKLNPKTRHLVSDINCGSGICDLNAEENLLLASNDAITNEMLGLKVVRDKKTNTKKGKGKKDEVIVEENSVDRELLIDFIRGENPDKTTRYHMGDMLHSDPLVVTYSTAKSDQAKQQYIFVGTNEGYLHAFDTTTGEEKFAFMPKELLKNIEPQYYNLDGNHLYGVDGSISHWQDKVTKKHYLYFGMRRGGTSYYALDVTNINRPKLLWKKSAADYPSMGQSWSAPYLDRVGYGEKGLMKEAVIISGGYDVAEDRKDKNGSLKNGNPSNEVKTSVGKNILVLDAKTGRKLWSLRDAISTSKVEDSVPGGLKVLDTNANGIADRIYFADTGGNVWRVDLSESIGSNSRKSTLTKLASLAGSGVNARKFYSAPEVASVVHKGKLLYTVSIGSGYRAHPMNEKIDDKFFILIDDLPKKPIGEDFTTIKINNLAEVDITAVNDDVSLSTRGGFNEDGKRGWVVSFPQTGEKVLTKALTRNGAVIFTTFVPDSGEATCGIANGSVSRLYALNVVTGKAGINFDKPAARETLLNTPVVDGGGSPRLPGSGYPGIVPPPELVFGSFEIDKDGVCKHPVDYRLGRKASPVSGYSACSLEPAYWSNPLN